MKQKEEYEAQIGMLKAELACGTIVFDKGPDLTIADLRIGMTDDYLKDYENHQFAEDNWRMLETEKMVVKMVDDLEEGEDFDA
jgi:hypothetical protein